MTPQLGPRSRPWRSWLFVPADNERVLTASGTRGADVIICDLEDAVADSDKRAARQLLSSKLAGLAGSAAAICVRVNSGLELPSDLAVAVHPAVDVVMLPKVESCEEITDLARQIAVRECENGQVVGRIGIVALIETPRGVLRLPDIAPAPGLVGLAFGSEDYSAHLGVGATDTLLETPVSMIAIAAAAERLMSIGTGTSLRNFGDPEQFQAAAARARDRGMTGALCIHPSQVAAVNRAFELAAEDVAWAQLVIARWNSSEAGVSALDGQMIDKPVLERAKNILRDASSRS